jgi:hypothetical protein
MAPEIEKFSGGEITDEMIAQAAELFSSYYGVWGSVAAEKMGVKQGKLSFSMFPRDWNNAIYQNTDEISNSSCRFRPRSGYLPPNPTDCVHHSSYSFDTDLTDLTLPQEHE